MLRLPEPFLFKERRRGRGSKRPFRNSLSGAQLVKQGFGLFHVERVEAFGKRTADWCKQVERLCFAVAVAQ